MDTDLFLGKPTIFWAALEAIGVVANAVIVAVTGLLVYGQLRTAAKSFHFDVIRKMQDLVDDFRHDRDQIFATFPIELVVSSNQFAARPPGRRVGTKISEGERRRMLLTPEQTKAVASLTPDQEAIARRVIGKLNDIGQLAEDGYLDYNVLLGKYHTMILRLCYFIEPVRRKIEDELHGGSYGQRLLRMRHAAMRYNKISPKHRNVDVKITTPGGSMIIVPAFQGNIFERIYWCLLRIVS